MAAADDTPDTNELKLISDDVVTASVPPAEVTLSEIETPVAVDSEIWGVDSAETIVDPVGVNVVSDTKLASVDVSEMTLEALGSVLPGTTEVDASTMDDVTFVAMVLSGTIDDPVSSLEVVAAWDTLSELGDVTPVTSPTEALVSGEVRDAAVVEAPLTGEDPASGVAVSPNVLSEIPVLVIA